MEKIFDNQCLNKDIKLVLDKGVKFLKSNLSGYSIEVQEGNGFKSYIYYDNMVSRDKDFNSINELRNNEKS